MEMDNSSKKVKFAYDPVIDDDDDYKSADEESNDLDLDTIRTSARKGSLGLKEFDSEGSDDEIEEGGGGNELNFDSDSHSADEAEEPVSEDERSVPIVPFNLKSDKEEGSFDADGFYIRKTDQDTDQDRWMANLTASDISSARRAHEKREKEAKMAAERKEASRSEVDLYAELAALMEESGNDLSVLDVLRSLKTSGNSARGKPSAPLNKNRLKKLAKEQQLSHGSDVDANKTNHADKAKLERITELADALMDYGNFGIYEETRRQIMYKLNKK